MEQKTKNRMEQKKNRLFNTGTWLTVKLNLGTSTNTGGKSPAIFNVHTSLTRGILFLRLIQRTSH